ncbi:hypothetical protein [Pyrococcus kukulkanii]|uniref:Uncharacterized protein n=1 Tax=Pyrococcus kukulkanii TaxID=1609559 RepID=A0A127BAK1_9EURY|nr:hypothetical protein [Pyrococcus kukulkanii]AMM53829.1 hypothetical protein TQ32_04540 [Pyrococcus kukulkanii]
MPGEKTLHDLVRDEIVNILRFYGFTAGYERPARIPEGGWGRADVVGHNGNITIGVEIVDTGDVARDAKKLVLNKYTYKYIVVLNYPKKVDVVIVDGEKVKVVDFESFEHELRRDLGIPPDYPYYSQPKVERVPEVCVQTPRDAISRVIEELQDIGLENFVDDVLDAMARIYISKHLQVEKRVGYNPAVGPIGPQEYKPVNVPPQVLSILEKLGYVQTERGGTGYDRKLIAKPTEEGSKLGHQLILERIEKHKERLYDLIRAYEDKIWIILHGSLVCEGSEKQSIQYVIHELERLYDGGAYLPRKRTEDLLEIASKSRILGMSPYAIIGYPCELPHSPIILLFSSFLAYSSLRELALRFFGELEKYGLAMEDYRYDSRWRPFEHVYKAPKEVFDYFTTRTEAPASLAYYAQQFGVYYILLQVSKATGRDLYEKLTSFLEISESMVAEVLAEMNRLGITSRLIDKPDKAPFIILDEKQFKSHIRHKLSEIAKIFAR